MEILYSEAVTEVPSWICAVFAVAVIMALVGTIHFAESKENVPLAIAIIGAAVSFLALGAIVLFCKYTETGRTRYEVILDEDYPVSKLYEEYIVKEQRGKIWILEDKESKER